MGNRGSRRRASKTSEPKHYGPAVEAINAVEQIRGTGTDSYDKLLAWMVEMAENDNDNVDTESFIGHLMSVCAEERQKRTIDVIQQSPCESSESSRLSKAHQVGNLFPRMEVSGSSRQNSYDSSGSSRFTRSGEDLLVPRASFDLRQSSYESGGSSRDDLLDPRMGFGNHLRQSSCESASSGRIRSRRDRLSPRAKSLDPSRQSSFESGGISLYSKSPTRSGNDLSDTRLRVFDPLRPSSFESSNMSPNENLDPKIRIIDSSRQSSYESTGSSRYSKSPSSKEDLLDRRTRFRRAMLSRQGTVDDGDDTDGASIFYNTYADNVENIVPEVDNENDTADSDTGLLSSYKETSFIKNTESAKRLKMGSRKAHSLSASIVSLVDTRHGFDEAVREKSKSSLGMRRMKSETAYVEHIPPISEEGKLNLFGDNLLEGNMAEILYSVEALWPRPVN